MKIKLGNRIIGENSNPYIIAEIGVNHEGSMEIAKKLIDQACQGGADAAKFQSYKADKIASKNSPSYWDLNKEPTTSQHQLFQKYDSFEEDDYRELSNYCDEVGIDFLSTPFDLDSVDFLDKLMPFYKISSSDITNTPLLKRVASKNKVVVLSTGASKIDEIKYAIEILNEFGAENVCLLHCILNYPTRYSDSNLNMIGDLIAHFPNNLIGYSDHTLPDDKMLTLTSAFLKGAVILEKHFTHNKKLPGNDHYHAMNKEDLKIFNNNIKFLEKIGGSLKKYPIESEKIARRNARRSIVLTRDLKKGHALIDSDLIAKRPGTGISPIFWDEIIGKTLNKDLKSDHILSLNELN